MNYRGLIVWLLANICGESACGSNYEPDTSIYKTVQRSASSSDLYLSSDGNTGREHNSDNCRANDLSCFTAKDKLDLEAIRALHKQLDDDKDGSIDYAESDDFLKEELKYNSGTEKRQRAFHRNNDMHISFEELWEAWLKSEVHNWTVEQTTDWLKRNVDLPQYVPNFESHKVTGANLPRLAINNDNFLGLLGIKDPIHKHKISLKAMDVVLFGPPKDEITWKDITLIMSAIVVLLGSWLAYQQNKKFKSHLNRMNQDMDSLQNSEQALEKMQKQLEEAKQAEKSAIFEKQNLEKMLQDSKGDFSSLTSSYSESDVNQYKEEIKALKAQLELTQEAYKNSCFLPNGLQQWLQLTYEYEQKSYDRKKIAAEKQLQQAREACEKLRKKRSSLIGAFVSTHGKAIDDVDRAIVEARSALNEVTYELQERSHRWRQIENLCGFPIMVNTGLQTLENMLYTKKDRFNGFASNVGRMNSVDDLDVNDDSGSVYGLGSFTENNHHHHVSTSWREEESSGSENGKQDENANESRPVGASTVTFQIGGGSCPEDLVLKPIQTIANSNHGKSASQSNINVKPPAPKITSRAFSQDIHHVEEPPIKTKVYSSSDGFFEGPKTTSAPRLQAQAIQETAVPPKKAVSIEDDICSTDSSVIEEVEGKKKKRKLFNFAKKSHKKDKSSS
ncbi:stromal interaction molecule homolog isoform X1 [Sitophilus oryzae]|uniref:Stromal interaction molecule homolog isoform X1 n=2 Tax=Sitophilus oryzae TaxID=7048 RepID=A0A6J2XI36_SITOR|nr:stromal interaction molecule homolog isoform X1 [Sitophilus oryzae]